MNIKRLLAIAAISLIISALSVAAVFIWIKYERYGGSYDNGTVSEFEEFELKPGKYLLHRTWGYDETDYIEIFDDGTIQFTGEYWENNDEETRLFVEKEGFAEGLDVFYTQRQKYSIIPNSYSIAFVESVERAYELGMFACITYVDENAFEITRERSEKDDVVDYLPKDKEYDSKAVRARYIYSE